jgi:hypothetical protein
VLGLQKRVAKDMGIRCHSDEIFGRHGLPDLVEESTVIDLNVGLSDTSESLEQGYSMSENDNEKCTYSKGGGDTTREALPILAVITLSPLEKSGLTAQNI